MSDNVTANLGSGGPVFATDDISGVHYPINKLAFGKLDSATLTTELARFPVDLGTGTRDSFGKIQTVNCLNDIDVQFYRDDPGNLVTVTTVSSGAAAKVSGLMQMTTTTTTNSQCTAVSRDNTVYRSGGEIYCLVTAAFPTALASVSGSYMRIGLYDSSNGFYLGYEYNAASPSFGVSVRNNAADTFVAKASFSEDTLTGAATSKFTRAGTPEAIDLTKLNVFRIRFGWLGAAPVKFEVLSPDGEWVLFHVIKQPNLSATPHIQNADLPITADIKNAGTTAYTLNTACWGAGCTYDKADNTNSGTLGTATNSVVNFRLQGIAAVRVRVNTTATGTIIFECTADGSNWITHPYCFKVGTSFDTLTNAAVTPTAGDIYLMSGTEWRGVRVRTASTLGNTVNVTQTGEGFVSLIKAVQVAPAPHNIGYAIASKTVQATTAQTGTAIWTPASGKRLVITSYQIQCYGTTAGTLQIWFGGSADTTYTRGTDYAIFDGEFAPSTTSKPGVVQTGVWPSPTADFVLRYTTNTTISVTITVWGYEVV